MDDERSLWNDGELASAALREEAEPTELAELWSELVSGSLRVVGSECDGEWCYLSVAERKVESRVAARSECLDVLTRILAGEAQKELALELGLAPSVVAMRAARAVRAIGVDCRFARLPLLVILAFHRHRRPGGPQLAYARTIERQDERCRLIWTRRPDAPLRNILTDTELQVTRSMMEGRTYAEIARARKRSVRTIANQLAKTYCKLGVSGRASLVRWLMQHGAGDAGLPSARLSLAR